MVAIPDNKLPDLHAFGMFPSATLIVYFCHSLAPTFNGVFIGGSAMYVASFFTFTKYRLTVPYSRSGSKKEVLEMLDLAVKKNVRSWIELLPMKEASKAVNNVQNNNVRFRHVLKADL
ncbi:hypothetical protein H0H93_014248 [Arthromyces matolae]|nr:hypothetical protein H0H93_014248 [Arthromyces matolae]